MILEGIEFVGSPLGWGSGVGFTRDVVNMLGKWIVGSLGMAVSSEHFRIVIETLFV